MHRSFLPFLAGAAFGLIAGFGLTYLVFVDREPSRFDEPRPSRPVASPERSPKPPDEEPAPEAPIVAPAEGFRSLGDALAAIPSVSFPSGSGEIRGRVATQSGLGVAGVVIRATAIDQSRRSRRSGVPPPRRDLETVVRETVAEHRRGRVLDREARTGADGGFVLSEIGDQPYSLRAYLEGYEFQAEDWQKASRARAGTPVNFTATPVAGLRVSVRLPNGKPPERATIACSRGNNTSNESWTPDDPLIEIAPGTYRVRAEAGDDQEYASDETLVTLEAGIAPPEVAFDLHERIGIRGRIVGAAAAPNSMFTVYLMKHPPDTPPDAERLRGDGRQTWVGSHDGKYAFLDLAPGTYAVGASHANGPVTVQRSVDVAAGIVEVDLELPPLDEGSSIVVWVLAPDGTPLVSGVSMILEWRRARGGSMSTGVNPVPREDGAQVVPITEILDGAKNGDGSEAVRAVLTVNSDDFGRVRVEFRPGVDRELTVRFTEPAFLEATVAGYVGSGLEGYVRLRLEPARRDEPQDRNTFYYFDRFDRGGIDMEGRQHFGPVQPGSHDLVLSVRAGDEEYFEIPARRVPVELAPGENRVTVSLPAVYSLTIVLPEGSSGTQVHLQKKEKDQMGGAMKTAGDSGRVVFERVPAGTYRLNVWGAGQTPGQMTVRVPEESVIRWEPENVNCLEVTITDPSGYLATAGFLDGDRIIGLDGTEFESMAQMQTLLATVMGKEEARLLVLRGGGTLEIVIDPRKMMSGDFGGDMDPSVR